MLHLSAACTSKSILSGNGHRSDTLKQCLVKQAATLLFQTSSAPSFRFKSLSIKAIAGTMSAVETDSRVSKRALISLSDKTDLAVLGAGLQELGFTIVSTGGTASALDKAGISATKVEDLTGFPEMLDGRVKTLHPNIHGGILARRERKHHMEALKKHGIGTFDVVVVNLYPFYEKVTAAGGISYDEAIENIDIGGTTMIKASAKNHKDVLVVVDSKDYPSLLEYLRRNKNDQKFRENLAYKAFQHVVAYDSAVLEWMSKQDSKDKFPSILNITLQRKKFLRYGENEHQKAALYADKRLSAVSAGENCIQHHGEDLSYSNRLDVEAAWNCVCEFNKPTCVIVKHASPCGIASNNDIIEAYRFAVKADPKSAYGGVVAFNVEVDEDIASEIRQFRNPVDGTPMFYHIVVASKFSKKGLQILKGKSNKLKILQAREHKKGEVLLRQIGGGDWLAQESDDLTPDNIQFKCVSDKNPQESETNDAKFAYLCVKHIKSNAIVLAKDERMLGMGGGQPNRLESLKIALKLAGDQAKGAVLASDGFFPFDDAVEEARQRGVSVIAEPGGSIRDQDVINCCNKYGVTLLFTGVRHFRH